MRIMKIKGFITPMDINTGSCEDSMAINLTNGRIAVADGVTNSVHPEIVSSLLCNHFVKGDIMLSDWPIVFENKLLPSISEEWKSKEEILFSILDEFDKDLAEIKRKRKGPGASTFAGIEIDKVNNKVNYLILGDCTLFFIKQDGSYFAINSGQESHEKGDLLNFNSTPNCIVVGGLGQPQKILGEWLTGSFNIESGYILLMTDGCAEWFQGAYAKDSNVLDNLWSLSDNDAFAKLAEQERTLNGKMDDDLAVIMLKIDTDIFQMEYFPTGQSQTILIDKTGNEVTVNADNNNVNLENDDNENNEEKEVPADVNESKLSNESEKEEIGETDEKVIIKDNNIDESDNDESDHTESINHNGAEIPQEPKDNTNTITNNSDSESIETNEDMTIQDKGTGEASCLNETVVEINPQDDDLIAKEEQNSTNVRFRQISDKQTIMCPFCGKIHYDRSRYCPDTGMRIIFCPFCGEIHHEGIVYCPKTGKTMPNLLVDRYHRYRNKESVKCPYCGEKHKSGWSFCPETGKPMLMAERGLNETKVSDKVTQVLPKIICKVCGTHYDTDTCPNCGQLHPASVKKTPLTLSASVPIQAVLSKEADEKKQGVNKSDDKVERETYTTLKDIPSATIPVTSIVPENSAENQIKDNIGNVIHNQEKMDEEDVISDSIDDNLEAAQIDINASDEDNHLPPTEIRDEQIVDVNVNIETVDSLTKNDSSVPVVQQSDTETLVEEANSKDETSQTPTEDFLEEIDVNASESLPEASLIGNPVGDNNNSHNINKS